MKIRHALPILCALLLNLFFAAGLKAEPVEGAEDIVCAATLPCSPPAFEVFDAFKTGPCAGVYKTSCARWREIKIKSDALDLAVQKLVECQKSKTTDKNKNKGKK